MSVIRIRKKLDSDTLYVPELKSYIGRTVEIVVEEPAMDQVSEQARVRAILDHIAAHRVTPAPGTPDSTEMLREDRAR